MCVQSEGKLSWFFLLRKMFNWLSVTFPAICVSAAFSLTGQSGQPCGRAAVRPCGQTEEAGSRPHFPGSVLTAASQFLIPHPTRPWSLLTWEQARKVGCFPTGTQQPGRPAFSGPGLTALPWASPGGPATLLPRSVCSDRGNSGRGVDP